MCFSCSAAPFPTPPPEHEDTRPGHNDAKEGGQVGQERERNDDEGGDGHNVRIPRKGTFFLVKVNYVILTPSLPSLAIPPSPLNTPNTKNAPHRRVFHVQLVHLHPETPSSSQTPPLEHQNMKNTCWITCFSCSMASFPHPSAQTRKSCQHGHNFRVQALHYPRHKNATLVLSLHPFLHPPPPRHKNATPASCFRVWGIPPPSTTHFPAIPLTQTWRSRPSGHDLRVWSIPPYQAMHYLWSFHFRYFSF